MTNINQKKHNSLISVNMPVYNGEKYIKQAIQSVLDQTYKNLELIIIDDCSTDSTARIISSFKDNRIKYYKLSHKLNVSKARNEAISKSNGQYLMIMDADDVCMPQKTEKQINFLKMNQSHTFVGSWAENINEKGQIVSQTKPPISSELLVPLMRHNNCFIHSSIMINRDRIKGLLYNEQLDYAEDYDILLRLQKTGKSYNIPEFLIKYRITNHSTTAKLTQKHKNACLKKIHGINPLCNKKNLWYLIAKSKILRDSQRNEKYLLKKLGYLINPVMFLFLIYKIKMSYDLYQYKWSKINY